jgi:hypothetical protein
MTIHGGGKERKSRGTNRRLAYAEAALEGEKDKVAGTTEGDRNNQLFRSTAKLGEFVAAGELSPGDVAKAMTEAATEAGLAEDPQCKPKGIARTIASGLKRTKDKPRDLSHLDNGRRAKPKTAHRKRAVTPSDIADDDDLKSQFASMGMILGSDVESDLFTQAGEQGLIGDRKYSEKRGRVEWSKGPYLYNAKDLVPTLAAPYDGWLITSEKADAAPAKKRSGKGIIAPAAAGRPRVYWHLERKDAAEIARTEGGRADDEVPF